CSTLSCASSASDLYMRVVTLWVVKAMDIDLDKVKIEVPGFGAGGGGMSLPSFGDGSGLNFGTPPGLDGAPAAKPAMDLSQPPVFK
ncbi:hypothetical protein HGO36_20660, partial [Agrobacterium vitis]|nr:hypothetical protein [Agrobacterium vitis]